MNIHPQLLQSRYGYSPELTETYKHSEKTGTYLDLCGVLFALSGIYSHSQHSGNKEHLPHYYGRTLKPLNPSFTVISFISERKPEYREYNGNLNVYLGNTPENSTISQYLP